MTAQRASDGAGSERDTEPEKLALDASVSPARVLAREPHHELTYVDRRPATAGRRCGYVQRRDTTSDANAEASPASQERRPGSLRQRPTERGEQRPDRLGLRTREPGARAPAAGDEARGSRSPSHAPTASTAQTAPAAAAVSSTEATTPCSENEPPRPPTLQIPHPSLQRARSSPATGDLISRHSHDRPTCKKEEDTGGSLLGLEIHFGGKLFRTCTVPLRSFSSCSSSCPPFSSVACSSGRR
jgi:hypothetical protein